MGRYKFRIAGSADVEPSSGTYYDGDTPPPGVYRTKVKRMCIKENKSKDDMISMVCEVDEPAKKDGKSNSKAQYNGYGIWTNLNITDDNNARINQFLMALSAGKKQVLKDWWNGGPRVDDNTPPNVLAIGAFKIEPTGMPIIVNAKNNNYQGNVSLQGSAFLLPSQITSNNVEADDDADDDIEDEIEDEDIDEDEGDEGDEGDEDDDVDEDDEYAEEEERREELEKLSLAAVKRTAKESGLGLADYRGKDKEEIVDLILEVEFTEEDEEEPEPEPEPEPPAPKRRGRPVRSATATKAAPAKAARRRRGPSF